MRLGSESCSPSSLEGWWVNTDGERPLELDGILLNVDRLVDVDEVRTPPRLYRKTPVRLGDVPRSAPAAITISFVVPFSGVPKEVKVLESVDDALAKRAIEAIAKWRYFPGVSHAGYPVNVRMSVSIPLASRG